MRPIARYVILSVRHMSVRLMAYPGDTADIHGQRPCKRATRLSAGQTFWPSRLGT